MTNFVTDPFTDPDTTDLESHLDSNGAAWVLEFTAGSRPIIVGNELAPYGNHIMRCGTPAPQADYTVAASFRQDVGLAAGSGFLCTRWSAGALTGYRAGIGTDGAASLYRFNAGTPTLLASDTSVPTYQQSYAWSLVVAGAGATVTVTFKVDGVTVLSWPDIDADRITAAGYPGIQNASGFNGQGFYIDDFVGSYSSGAVTKGYPFIGGAFARG